MNYFNELLLKLRDNIFFNNYFIEITILNKRYNVNLQVLNLSNNQLQSLPAEIGNLHNLQKLDLSNNQLQSLAAEIGNLCNLKELNLSNNQLQTLPAKIGNLHNLKK